MEACIVIHELVEAILCKHKAISTTQVDAFDMEFERSRPAGDDSEPGDDPQAPYYHEHQIATAVERILAVHLGVKWPEYGVKCASLSQRKEQT
jgi:hypothetical protein